MKYYYELYMDKHIEKQKKKIQKNIENDKWQLNVHLIALSKSKQNHLEIFHSVLLLQKGIAKDDLFIVGIANGYEEALELVEKITQEVYDKTKGTDIRSYILQRQQKYEEGNV